jgi:adenine-specific DNA-methyltransferase
MMQTSASAVKSKRPSKRKLTGAHYTPYGLASFLAKRISDHIKEKDHGLRITDPACGDGELLLALHRELPASLSEASTFVAIDQEPTAVANVTAAWQFENLEAHVEDFLSLQFEESQNPSLFEEGSSVNELADVIIANPPYVRTQVLGAEKAQQLALAFELTGRVDLYHAFLVGMTKALRPGGLLGVITSNRFLTTKGGASVRAFLESNYDILEIIDLGDTKLFEAAVLPAIFIGRKKVSKSIASGTNGKFIRIYEDLKENAVGKAKDSVYAVLLSDEDGSYTVDGRTFKLTTGTITLNNPSEPWQLVCENEHKWLHRVEARSSFLLGQLMHIRVGIKTCADSVFIRKDWASVPSELRPEPPILRPLIDSEDCSRWSTDLSNLSRKVLYPYTVENGKRCLLDLNYFPKSQSYFEHYRAKLEGRTYLRESSREWYEIWVPHNPQSWSLPMLVVPDISPVPKFLFTSEGAIVNGNCYWLTLRHGLPNDYLFLVLGIANSQLMTEYHDLAFNNKLYAGRRRYLTQYIEKYPIPSLDSECAQDLVDLVKKRVFGVFNEEKVLQMETEIERAVRVLYGFEA